jgi:hypothetical protein
MQNPTIKHICRVMLEICAGILAFHQTVVPLLFSDLNQN